MDEGGVWSFKEEPPDCFSVLRQPPPHTVRSIGHGARGWLAVARVRQQDGFYILYHLIFFKSGDSESKLCRLVQLAHCGCAALTEGPQESTSAPMPFPDFPTGECQHADPICVCRMHLYLGWLH